jgi:hypothetical protein
MAKDTPENALIGSEKRIPAVDQHNSEEMGLKKAREM